MSTFKILQLAGDIELLELCAKTCYKSRTDRRGKMGEEFIKWLIERGHHSVLEHSIITVDFNGVSRGFCYDDKTEVLTKDGWKMFKDTTDKDEFFTLNPYTYKDEYQKRLSTTIEKYNGDLICGKSSMVDFAVTPNHRMFWWHYDSRSPKWKIDKASGVYGRRVKFMRGIFNDFNSKEKINIEYPNQDSLWFAKFLGLFNTDGSIYKGKTSGGRVSIVQIKKTGRKYVKEVLDNLNFNYKELKTEYRINNTELYNFLIKYYPKNKSLKGRVPNFVKNANSSYIKAFLDGCIAGDGNIHKTNGHTVIYTSSKLMADDYQECILKTGQCSSIRIDDRRGQSHSLKHGQVITTKNIGYIVSITKKNNRHLFNKKHWYKKPYNGNVYCVTVPNGILYVRRNGKAFWCGNTHEMVRHRLASFSQTSTRYTDPRKTDEFEVVLPDKPIPEYLKNHISDTKLVYANLLADGWAKQDARQILPIGIKTQIVVSANFREWRHILQVRTDISAHWEIRNVMLELLSELKKSIPVIFDDIGD